MNNEIQLSLLYNQKRKINCMKQDEKQVNPELSKERQKKHRKLIKMIKQYKRSPEQIKKLERIKQNTQLQINLRYIRSQHNRTYIFPRNSFDSEQDQKQKNPFTHKESQFYDLRTQNQIAKKQLIQNIQFMESSKRVKSLDRQHHDVQSHRLGRFQQSKGLNLSNSSQKLKTRQKSMGNVKRVLSNIKLPQLIRKQNLKTQSKNGQKSIQKIVGRKLLTQANSPSKQMTKKDIPTSSRKKLQSLKQSK